MADRSVDSVVVSATQLLQISRAKAHLKTTTTTTTTTKLSSKWLFAVDRRGGDDRWLQVGGTWKCPQVPTPLKQFEGPVSSRNRKGSVDALPSVSDDDFRIEWSAII